MHPPLSFNTHTHIHFLQPIFLASAYLYKDKRKGFNFIFPSNHIWSHLFYWLLFLLIWNVTLKYRSFKNIFECIFSRITLFHWSTYIKSEPYCFNYCSYLHFNSYPFFSWYLKLIPCFYFFRCALESFY